MPTDMKTNNKTWLKRISVGQHCSEADHPTNYRWVAAGEFPKQISIGANSVVWLESDVTKWMDQRIGAG